MKDGGQSIKPLYNVPIVTRHIQVLATHKEAGEVSPCPSLAVDLDLYTDLVFS